MLSGTCGVQWPEALHLAQELILSHRNRIDRGVHVWMIVAKGGSLRRREKWRCAILHLIKLRHILLDRSYEGFAWQITASWTFAN